MSEYQYYEFRAIDRPLTERDMMEVRRLSTRATITSTSFVNVYHFGDFSGDPVELMERYYDAFLYVANWGMHQVMLRLPTRLLDPATAERYCVSDFSPVRVTGDYVILSFDSESGNEDWEEGEGWLTRLHPIRDEMASGEDRTLYLGWLFSAQELLDEEEVEPPVPSGLRKLRAAQKAFVEFLRIGEHLLAVAAERSPTMRADSPSSRSVEQWIRGLAESEKDTFLARLVAGEPQVRAEILRRFQDEASPTASPAEDAARTVGALLRAAEERANV